MSRCRVNSPKGAGFCDASTSGPTISLGALRPRAMRHQQCSLEPTSAWVAVIAAVPAQRERKWFKFQRSRKQTGASVNIAKGDA